MADNKDYRKAMEEKSKQIAEEQKRNLDPKTHIEKQQTSGENMRGVGSDDYIDPAKMDTDNVSTSESGHIPPRDSGERFKSADAPMIPNGYKEVHIEDLPSKGRFYPVGMQVLIKAATTRDIEHWSTMDERDLIDVERHYNDILATCVKINGVGRAMNYKDILEADKLFLLLSIKDFTFVKGENVIKIPLVCKHCGHENIRELNNTIIDGISKSDETLEKYYDDTRRIYNVKTKKYGLIEFKPPTIGMTDFIFQHGRNMETQKKQWNKSFFQILPYLNVDWRDVGYTTSSRGEEILKPLVQDLQMDYETWEKSKVSVIYRLADMIKVGIDPMIKINCASCSREVEQPLRFPDGAKSLFIISDISGELA